MTNMRLLLCIALCFVACILTKSTVCAQMRVTQDQLKNALQNSRIVQDDWDSIYDYGVNYFLYADTGKLVSDLAMYTAALDTSQELEPTGILMQGIVWTRRRQYDSAISVLQRALKTGIENTDIPLIFYANLQLCQVFQRVGYYPLALLSCNEGLNAASRAKNTKAIIYAYTKKSELFFELRTFRRSLESLRNAYILLDGKNIKKNDNLRAAILKDEIKCFAKLGTLDSLLMTKKKLDGLSSNDPFIEYAKTCGNVEANRIENNFSQQITDLQKLLNITRTTAFEDPLNVAVELGKAFYNNGQYNEALKILDSVEHYVAGLNQLSVLRDLYLAKAQAYSRMNNLTAALNYYEMNERIYDSISVNSTIAKNMDMSISVSTLKNNLGEAVKEKNLQRKVVIFTIVISVLSLTLLFLLFRYVVNRNKMHRMEMKQQMKELSFINSHEVRKYLANIMGIVEVIKMEDHSFEVYKQFEDALFKNVDDLDQSIKTLAQKLYGAEGAKEETS